MGFASWKMIRKAKETKSIHNNSGLWILIGFAWFFATILFFWTIAEILASWLFITRGWHHKWAFQVHGNSMPRAEALDGIRAALGERISAHPHDKSFALFGILKTYGAIPPTPDYTLTVGETYRVLFQTLLNWQHTALFMLFDAGGDVRDDCPSWVPNWETRTRNQWLSSRYFIGSTGNATPLMTNLNFECSPTGLRVKGQPTGKVLCTLISTLPLALFRTPLPPRQTSGLSTVLSLQAILYGFLLWVDAIKVHSRLDPFQSVVFAVLEGLTPKRGPTTRVVTKTDDTGAADNMPRAHTEIEYLPLWEGPYNYSSRKQDFLDCCELLDILGADIRPGAKDGATLIDGQLKALLDKVKTKKQAFNYFVKACGRMSADRRGCFVLSSGMVGTGPLNMREGDEVFLLAGVPAPMALRPIKGGNAFKVVGPALVHGMMHGEIFKVDKLEDITLQ